MDKNLKIIPKGSKKDTWLERICDYYIDQLPGDDIRNFRKIEENYELLSGDLKLDELNKTLNPMELKQSVNDVTTTEQIIPAVLPTINTLMGEIYDRNIDFRAYVMNPDAVSKKEDWMKTELNNKLQSIINNTNLSQDEIELELSKIKQWEIYDSQDLRERAANHLIKDYSERLKLQKVTAEGWKDIIICAQEIYLFDIVKGNVIFERIHPTQLDIHGLPMSGEIHKSEAIVYTRYMTIGEIVERFSLKESEIKKLIKDKGEEISLQSGITMVFRKDDYFIEDGKLIFNSDTNSFTSKNDMSGEMLNKIEVKTVYFKALRKVGKLHYINDITGLEEIKLVSEEYNVNEEIGEFIEWEYVNEWWTVTKINNDIYTESKQCPVQMRDMNNKSDVMAPICGIILRNGRKIAKSIVDYLKPIQYQWTVFSKRTNLLWSRNWGKLVRLDLTKLPVKHGFDLDLWLSWITSFGIIVEDPLNEAMKGISTGGQFASSVSSVDMELSSSIQQAISYMSWLIELAEQLIGVSRQRKGELLASDGLGTTQEAVARSLKITEELFQGHHNMMQTVLYYILEYGKTCLIDKDNFKAQYITDDLSYNMYSLNVESFKDIDFGIFINNTKKQFQLEQVLLQLAHAYAQNGLIKLSEIMELYNTNSMSDKINKLKIKEKENELRQQQSEQSKMQQEKEIQDLQMQLRREEMQHEIDLQKLKNEGIIEVARIQSEGKINEEVIKDNTKKEQIVSKERSDNTKAFYNYKNKQEKNINK